MRKTPLGMLERVELREYWKNEASDFTPWLAAEENLHLLGGALGLELELREIEAGVGKYSVDIVCRNTMDGSTVVIENQLEPTDHSHLGQLLTYGAGTDARTVIWVAKQFTEEHRAAVEWLNRVSGEGFNFFGIEIELWRIGDSVPAPKFNVVAEPNDWSRFIKDMTTRGGSLTPAEALWFDYWQSFGEFLIEQRRPFTPPKPQACSWVAWGIGRSGAGLFGNLSTRDKHIDVSLELTDANSKAWFSQLLEQREAIESELGFEVGWREQPNNKKSQIIVSLQTETTDKSIWPDLHRWMLDQMLAMDRAFRHRVREL